jgi:hypothetical protein
MIIEDMGLMEALEMPYAPIKICAAGLTGTSGTYARADPIYDDVAAVLAAMPAACPFDAKTLREEAHVTIVYSREHAADMSLIDKSAFDLRCIEAKITGIEHWDGHDGDGYVVLKLASESLAAWNRYLIDAGAQHSFPDYSPHLSLCSKAGPKTPEMVSWMESACEKLVGMCLCFDAIIIEDIKK